VNSPRRWPRTRHSTRAGESGAVSTSTMYCLAASGCAVSTASTSAGARSSGTGVGSELGGAAQRSSGFSNMVMAPP